jgi:hypothetical protein
MDTLRIGDVLQKPQRRLKSQNPIKKTKRKVISQMQAKTVSWNDIRQQILAHPEVQAEYEALEEEFILTRQVISFCYSKESEVE